MHTPCSRRVYPARNFFSSLFSCSWHKTSLSAHLMLTRAFAPMSRRCILTSCLLVLVLDIVSASSGSCKEARLCCPGRDASCAVQKTRDNEISDELVDRVCYCDSACTSVGDCCFDYQQTCGGERHRLTPFLRPSIRMIHLPHHKPFRRKTESEGCVVFS